MKFTRFLLITGVVSLAWAIIQSVKFISKYGDGIVYEKNFWVNFAILFFEALFLICITQILLRTFAKEKDAEPEA